MEENYNHIYKYFHSKKENRELNSLPTLETIGGFCKWYKNGIVSRLDGPACLFLKHKEEIIHHEIWYIDGKYLPKDEIEDFMKECDKEYTGKYKTVHWSEEDLLYLRLKF